MGCRNRCAVLRRFLLRRNETIYLSRQHRLGSYHLATHNELYRQFRVFCLHLIDELRDFPHQTNALNSKEKTIPEISNDSYQTQNYRHGYVVLTPKRQILELSNGVTRQNTIAGERKCSENRTRSMATDKINGAWSTGKMNSIENT